MGKRIIEELATDTIQDNDFILMDNNTTPTGPDDDEAGTRKIRASEFGAQIITVDDELSDSSENPVQNKVITGAINDLASATEITGTASGSIASFDDGSVLPLRDLNVSIIPTQDLHGYDNPWVGGGGKNKCDLSAFTHTGITTDQGAVTTQNNRLFSASIPVKSNTKYTLSIVGSKSSESIYANRIIYFDSNNDFIERYTPGNSQTVTFTTIASASYLQIDLRTSSLLDIETTDVSKIQLEEGQSATTWTPYENICPISGWTACNVTVCDDVDNPTVENEYTIQFTDGTNPLTVYGGTLDATTGVLTVDRVSTTVNNLSWSNNVTGIFSAQLTGLLTDIAYKVSSSGYSYGVNNFAWGSAESYEDKTINTSSNDYVYVKDTSYANASDFKTAMGSVQLVYELATPQTYSLTPTMIQSILGRNNVFVDTGEVLNCEYVKNTNIAISKMSPKNYSTAEQDTGLKWIDGRPIYQKTFYIASLNNGASSIVDSNFTPANYDVCFTTFQKWNYTYQNVLYLCANNIGGSGSSGRLRIISYSSGLSVTNLNSGFAMTDICFTIQYTKVADRPVS